SKIEGFLNRIDALHKEYEKEKIKQAFQKWKAQSDDPDVSQTVGEFWCFFKQDWKKGLPLLSKASDPLLAATAGKELTPPGSMEEQVALGDAWFELAKTRPTLGKAMQKRAAHWYAKALPDLKGQDKERVEKHILELTRLLPELRGGWDHLILDRNKAVGVGGSYLRVLP